MQEEMRKNTLGSLVENEKKGTIYAKIIHIIQFMEVILIIAYG